jgi:DNA polymerase (family 10)
VRSLPQELQQRIAQGFDPDSLPGIGADLTQKILELIDTGHCQALDRMRRSVPAGLRDLLVLPGIGPQRARALFAALNIRNIKDLQRALDAHQVREIPGFGAKSEASLQKALAQAGQHAQRLPWNIARQYGTAIRRYLAGLPGVTKVELAGSYRRGRETVGDLDIVMCADVAIDLHAALSNYGETARILAAGPTRCSIVLRSDLQVDVRLVPAESFGAALYYFTGSKAHNIHVRRLAVSQGLKINEYGVSAVKRVSPATGRFGVKAVVCRPCAGTARGPWRG